MRGRFGIQVHLDHYQAGELATIVRRSAAILNAPVDESSAMEIGKRSRGTPRLANRYLRRARDFAQVEGQKRITLETVNRTLERLDVDTLGLDMMDKRILHSIIEKFGGGPVGLGTLAISISEDTDTLEEVYEPFLIMAGLLQRTSRGREATAAAYKHLGLKPGPGANQTALF
jgi:Holliday junction DNA helicase RuvB